MLRLTVYDQTSMQWLNQKWNYPKLYSSNHTSTPDQILNPGITKTDKPYETFPKT
jgi:hypothetical protein